MKEGECMFAVMIGNEPGDATKIKRTVSVLRDVLTIATVDKGKIAGLSHDIPDIEDLLVWFSDIDSVMNSIQYADTEV